jgi:hypothetical protein
MRDGSVSWNRARDTRRGQAGRADRPDVGVVYFDTPQGKPLATYVNFALHPDTVGGEAVSADYPGVLARLLAEYKGADMLTHFANGCCGNVTDRDLAWTDAQKGPPEARRIGTSLAGVVCKTYPRLTPLVNCKLGVKSEVINCRCRPSREDVTKAGHHQTGHDPKFLDKVKAYQTLDVVARDGKPWRSRCRCSLGDKVAWVSLPGEIFASWASDQGGVAVQAHADRGAGQRSIGYIPDKRAYPQGSYEVVSPLCRRLGEMLVEAAVRLLKELARPGQTLSRQARPDREWGTLLSDSAVEENGVRH